MSHRFWQIERVSFEGGSLQIQLSELTTTQEDVAPPVTIAGVVVAGHSLRVRANSKRTSVAFSEVTEFRAVPEQCSWPAYEDGTEIVSYLLYKKPGAYFYGQGCTDEYQCFDKSLGWVSVDCLQCYIIHSESFDIYVLSSQSPVID